MHKVILSAAAIFTVAAAGTAYAKKPAIDKYISPGNFTLVFNSGFEPGSKIVSVSATRDYIEGVDRSVPGPNSWDELRTDKFFRFTGINYEDGDSSMRTVRIVPDPVNPSNGVLRLWIGEPSVKVNYERGIGHTKARAQVGFDAGEPTDEIYQSVRLYLPDGMKALRDYPDSIPWLTIVGWWNNPPDRRNEHIFRINVGLNKRSGTGQPLYFKATSQNFRYDPIETTRKTGRSGQFTTKWEEAAENYSIPFGEWMTLEYYIKKGHGSEGRFYMTVHPDGGKKRVLFDIAGDTYGEDNPSPQGVVRVFNAMNLYTSGALVEYMRRKGEALQLYWDDLKIYRGKSAPHVSPTEQ